MKIALLARGVAETLRACERTARTLEARGHETRVFLAHPQTPAALALAPCLAALRSFAPDATLSFGAWPCGWIAGFADVVLGIPSVLWMTEADEIPSDPSSRRMKAVIFAMRQARRNLAPGSGQRARLLAAISHRDPLRAERIAQRVDVVGTGVDLPVAMAPGEGQELLFVGGTSAGDGLPVLVEAIGMLPRSRRPTLWMVGRAPMRAAMTARARELEVDASFLGDVDRAAFANLYGRCRALVVPATTGEARRDTMLDAMAHGVPTIATDLPGVRELLEAGGRVVSPGHRGELAAAIDELADPDTRQAAARASRRAAEANAWPAAVERVEAVLQEIRRPAPRVWVVSPNPTSRGGVAAVARQIATSPLTRKYRISMLPTYAPGSMLGRLYRGAIGIVQVGTVILFKKPDLVHVKVASGGSFARKIVVGAICRLRGVPVLVHVHGGGFDAFLRKSPGFVRTLAHWWFDGTSQVLTLSDRWAAKLKPMFPNARIDVLPNPIEVRCYEDLAQDRFARPLAAAPDAAPMALFLGDLLVRKGAHALVQAWPEVVRRFPEARLVLCGTGDTAGLRALAAELGVAERIELPGWVELEAKRRLLAQATAFVLPSHIEGVPISLLEAMASGLPSVVTPVGGILDAVSDETEALIVPVEDVPALAKAILRLFESPALARRLGEAARARVDEFDVGAFSLQLDRIYRRILGDEPPPAAQAEARASSAEVA